MSSAPQTLVEAILYFEDPDRCLDYLIPRRWPDGITCPHCESTEDHYFLKARKRWRCKSCRKKFSLKQGTIFEDSKLPLKTWLVAIWIIVNAKNGASSHELSRSLGVTQKTAWFMLQRIRYALHVGGFNRRLEGIVEVDETYIGGKFRNMHARAKERRGLGGRGTSGKTIVMGLLERDGEVRTMVIRNTMRESLQDQIRLNVESGSEVHTDEHSGYEGLEEFFTHEVIKHAETYVRDHVYTNGVENYWSLLKRTIKGTYISVEPFHLFRYLDEQSFRFNYRKDNDQERFERVTRLVAGKRLPYATLIGARSLASNGESSVGTEERVEEPEE